MLRRIPIALAAAAVAHCVAILAVIVSGHAVSSWFVASHALIAIVVGLVAMSVGGIARDRAWAALVFVIPIVLTLRLGRELASSALGMAACFGIAFAIATAWVAIPRRQGSPVMAALTGGIAAAGLSFLRAGQFVSPENPLLLGVGLVALLAAAGALAANALAGLALPGTRTALFVAGLALALSVGASRLPTGPVVAHGTLPANMASSGAPVILIVLDTVRADHLAMHGYARDTMPNLERFARNHAVVFERGIANGASSLPSHASLFTGLYPPNHGAHQMLLDDPTPPAYGYPLPADVPTLSALLSQRGYWSVGISGNFGPLSPEFGLARGFDSYSAVPNDVMSRNGFSPFAIESRWSKRIPVATTVFTRLNEVPPFRESDYFMDVPYRRAATITDAALEVLEIAGDRPFFLFLNYLDAHRPYYPPYPYRARYSGRSADQHPFGLNMETRTAVLRGERNLTAAEHAHVTALYDGELTYLDSELERLFEALREHPSWDDMLVLITSDHGEAFGDHGHLYHSINLYDESVHVPTIIKPGKAAPAGFVAGSRQGNLIQSVDLFATVLAYTGIVPPTTIDGRAWGVGRREGLGWLYLEEVNLEFSEELYRRELVTIERDGWKLIRSSMGTVELYDIARDPESTHNLAEDEPERARSLAETFDALGIVSRATAADGEASSEDSLTRLRALGYVK